MTREYTLSHSIGDGRWCNHWHTDDGFEVMRIDDVPLAPVVHVPPSPTPLFPGPVPGSSAAGSVPPD